VSQINPALSLLKTRRSVRHFLDRAVPEDVIQCILEAATWAPSAHNRQPWRFAVLTGKEVKSRLAVAISADFRRDLISDGIASQEAEARVQRSIQRIQGAPVAIVLCLDQTELDAYPDPRRQEAERLMAVQSAALAGGNLLLAAHAEGLGGVWVCAPLFAPETVQHALGLPREWQPQALLLVGYPAKNPTQRQRRPLEEVVRYYG